ncbi:FliI/YscN family ATPase [Syntrophorhabdus aromaticivorans]|uniref:FliI/YscN family ATPase n=1 Tax=Syntrophorhabdus aromaticivorans TaxID=328301 RepID=A0A971M3V1_9BACT|nr:FliI/YscN family ATPase [Syntrophorhabdus aromaticivorans]NLW34867.1 FliI/YscN family ATPase [Syntrophorhabdus aromaticivorans]
MVDFYGTALEQVKGRLCDFYPYKVYGKVNQVVGLVIEGKGPISSVGDGAVIYPVDGGYPIDAEVVGFKDGKTLLMALGDLRGVGIGSKIVSRKQAVNTAAGTGLLGRVIDGLGNPMDNKGPIDCRESIPIYRDTINPMMKQRITEPLDLGIRSMNGLLTCGKGQRIGIFAGSGVGKSVLLGMIARHTEAKVNVIGLIGERGREVREFIERDLGDGIKHSVVIVATSDQPPLIRVRGAFLTIAIAEYFRDQGNDVLLLMDSLTRFGMAQREVGLAIGEPPTSKGYTPSVFSLLAKLLERAGNGEGDGTMTAIYTVLVEGDDLDDPIVDAARSILDGHVVLSRKLADSNHYPPVDVLRSVSRTMKDIVPREQVGYASRIVEILSEFERAEDLINIGAYTPGSNKKIDYAMSMIDKVRVFLTQEVDERTTLEDTVNSMKILFYV